MGLPTGISAEDDNEVYEMIYDSGKECTRCQEKIMLVEEVYLLWVVSAHMNGEIQILPVESDDEDFMFEPQFFCFSCWEANLEDLIQVDVEDLDVHTVHDDRSVYECVVCDSGIRLDESFGQAVLGEIRYSKKEPNGEQTLYYHVIGMGLLPICISCLKLMNEEVIGMWDVVDQEGECNEGTHMRCWRTGCHESCDLE